MCDNLLQKNIKKIALCLRFYGYLSRRSVLDLTENMPTHSNQSDKNLHPTLYSSILKPLQTKSNRVFRFSGLGAVT